MPKPSRYTGENTVRTSMLGGDDFFFEKGGMTSPHSFRRMMLLTGDNRNILALALGPMFQRHQGEYRSDVWRVEFGGELFWIFSSIKGTSYEWEVRADQKAISPVIGDLFRWLEPQIERAYKDLRPLELGRINAIVANEVCKKLERPFKRGDRVTVEFETTNNWAPSFLSPTRNHHLYDGTFLDYEETMDGLRCVLQLQMPGTMNVPITNVRLSEREVG